MGEQNAFGVLRLLSNCLNNPEIRLIVLTSGSSGEDQRKWMDRGTRKYLTEPFDGNQWLAIVELGIRRSIARKNGEMDPEMDDIGFFHRKENSDFQRFVENRESRRYRERDVIFREGDDAANMFYIRSGKIKTYKSNHSGKELITGIHKEGDCIGYVAMIGNAPHYMESAVAHTDAELLLIPKQDFLSALYGSPEIARGFMLLLSHSIHEVQNRLVELAYQSVRQKVAAALLRMHDYGLLSGETQAISISRKDLSSLIGTTPESLNRALYGLKEEGLIDLVNDGVHILDKSALTDLLQE